MEDNSFTFHNCVGHMVYFHNKQHLVTYHQGQGHFKPSEYDQNSLVCHQKSPFLFVKSAYRHYCVVVSSLYCVTLDDCDLGSRSRVKVKVTCSYFGKLYKNTFSSRSTYDLDLDM